MQPVIDMIESYPWGCVYGLPMECCGRSRRIGSVTLSFSAGPCFSTELFKIVKADLLSG